ncbi:TetR family transcriptional regulator C-terminal domain-containing protein [Rhodococcus sp. IEGM 1366]|uniref:TetR/AcrR family transcriptional regulator n=1 Tax=Rhodococcus sp. IEGM 1366 TaxID=3082223 RepID=UPI0029559ADD|nr:TetR family transcriptional regulator C-terminal domain-containing protein [Rhodococcus sp. IEGM 1366]MDV8070682.1 TetR family transcriptional regulator C-terminal domain-containing protein [Rhodococcus sp. IEGM 1366]
MEILDAAKAVIHTRGVTGINLKRIAEQAGLSSALLLYYYSDVDEILADAYRVATEEFLEKREFLIAEPVDAAEKLSRCLSLGTPYPGPREEAARVLYELQPLILSNTEAAKWSREFFRRQTALFKSIIESGTRAGVFRPSLDADSIAMYLVALEDGLATHALTGLMTPEKIESSLIAAAMQMVGSNAMGTATRTGDI